MMRSLLLRLLLISALSAVLSGCKKDDSSFTFLIEGDNPPFAYQGETQQRQISSDGRWDISVPSDVQWCSVTPKGGSKDGTISIKVTGNPVKSERQVILTILINGKRKTYPISQEGNPGTGSYLDGEVRVQEKNRETQPANLVFLGDGFIEADFTAGGTFDQAVAEGVEALFSVEPYKSYRAYFNIYKVAAISQQRGASYADVGRIRNTVFSTVYLGGSGMNTNDNKVFDYVRQVPGINLDKTAIFLIVNDPRYGGTTIMYSTGRSIAMCPMNRGPLLPGGFRNILVHEGGGHGFGRLADEYTNDVATPPSSAEINDLKQWFGLGYYDNVDLTGSLTEIKWKDFVGRTGYNAVGAYEGANYHEKGVWRPEYVSCMNDNRPYFNAPSRMSIVKRLMAIAGEPFTMDKFLAKDVERTAPLMVQPRMATMLPMLAPPILIDNR